jgi:hypothetical protein
MKEEIGYQFNGHRENYRRFHLITEKEMLPVIWGIKKFDYELRGRRFHLITDHKALGEIRTRCEDGPKGQFR